MKAVILFLGVLLAVPSLSNTNKYSNIVATFCKLKKGQYVRFDGHVSCATLVQRILAMTNTHSKPRVVITDSTENLASQIEVGDYIYFNNWQSKRMYSSPEDENKLIIHSHYAVVIGVDIANGKLTIAEQGGDARGNKSRMEINELPYSTRKGSLEVYKLVKGKTNFYSSRQLRPKH